jgi:hypothetical protein
MKNIQVIDGAVNCTYSIYSATEGEFDVIFPDGRDIEFDDDLVGRIGAAEATTLLGKIWERPVDKKEVNGIHGTLFFELGYKKKYYPTKKDAEMVVALD